MKKPGPPRQVPAPVVQPGNPLDQIAHPGADHASSKIPNPMDWSAIASILVERGDRPLALLDASGRIRMFNRSMERILGFSRSEVEGELWSRVCTPPEQEIEATRWIADAMRGSLQRHDVTALTKRGGQVVLRLEYALVGGGGGLIMTVTRTLSISTFHSFAVGRELDYDVSAFGREFGALRRLCADGEPLPIVDEQALRCYTVLYGRATPCDDCPMLRAGNTPWPRTLVRHRARFGDEANSLFEITAAHPIEDGVVRVRVRNVSEQTLGAIHDAKVQQLATRANLSRREREVLGYLLLGRGIDEMANALGISARTVKHHQASALQKLGAESKADLLRLLF